MNYEMRREKCPVCGVLFTPRIPLTNTLYSYKHGTLTLCRACSDSFDAWLDFYGGNKANENVKSPWDILREKEGMSKPDYGDAIQAIMDSGMAGSYIEDTIPHVKRGEDSEYYKAIIAIANSDLYEWGKSDAIKNMSKE